ncbi:MAG TPA: ATP-binding protein [Sandaracinaceae bacterium LLY-WYZ-13_1]|nr:ATP-binding protein [Sandaracinaceae bacterium LLY-WYZ-13_1]
MVRERCRVAVTGGPGGGKSTAVDLFRRDIGERVVVVPESATMLFAGGFPRTREPDARRFAQSAIYHVQRNLEDVYASIYPGRVLLCDRGTVDGAAYWPLNGDYFEAMGSSLDEELARYDAVLFFESAAVGGMSIEGGNPQRIEDDVEAVRLDRAMRALWSRHHRFVFVPHQPSFFEKIRTGLEAMRGILEAHYADSRA